MSGTKNNCSCVQNVDCCVRECRYHNESDHCSARSIHVENADAQRKGETFCSTFEHRAEL